MSVLACYSFRVDFMQHYHQSNLGLTDWMLAVSLWRYRELGLAMSAH
jgi:hypothetical protein